MKSRPPNDQEVVSQLDSAGVTKPITEADLDELRAAIAAAAYYRAEQRGFEPGYEMTDWLEAEKEVSAMHSWTSSLNTKSSVEFGPAPVDV